MLRRFHWFPLLAAPCIKPDSQSGEASPHSKRAKTSHPLEPDAAAWYRVGRVTTLCLRREVAHASRRPGPEHLQPRLVLALADRVGVRRLREPANTFVEGGNDRVSDAILDVDSEPREPAAAGPALPPLDADEFVADMAQRVEQILRQAAEVVNQEPNACLTAVTRDRLQTLFRALADEALTQGWRRASPPPRASAARRGRRSGWRRTGDPGVGGALAAGGGRAAGHQRGVRTPPVQLEWRCGEGLWNWSSLFLSDLFLTSALAVAILSAAILRRSNFLLFLRAPRFKRETVRAAKDRRTQNSHSQGRKEK